LLRNLPCNLIARRGGGGVFRAPRAGMCLSLEGNLRANGSQVASRLPTGRPQCTLADSEILITNPEPATRNPEPFPLRCRFFPFILPLGTRPSRHGPLKCGFGRASRGVCFAVWMGSFFSPLFVFRHFTGLIAKTKGLSFCRFSSIFAFYSPSPKQASMRPSLLPQLCGSHPHPRFPSFGPTFSLQSVGFLIPTSDSRLLTPDS
jgi:hypothetical protein